MNKKGILFEYHNICIHTHTQTHTPAHRFILNHMKSIQYYLNITQSANTHTHTHTCLQSAAQTKNLVEYYESNVILFEYHNIHTHTHTQTRTHKHTRRFVLNLTYLIQHYLNIIPSANTRTHTPACCRLPRRWILVKIMSLIQCWLSIIISTHTNPHTRTHTHTCLLSADQTKLDEQLTKTSGSSTPDVT